MDKKELYQYVGSMQQMAYIRKVTCEEGRSTGLRMFDVKNECLQYQSLFKQKKYNETIKRKGD